LLLHGRDREHTPMSVLKVQPGFFRLHGPRLKEQDACNDLQAVGDPVLQFQQQDVLLLEKFRHLPLDAAPRGHILDAQKDQCGSAALLNHLTGLQQHGALAKSGIIMFDVIGLYRGLFGKDFLQQPPEFRNVPLTVAQRVHRAALHILPATLKAR
jgi:hypothetical protein